MIAVEEALAQVTAHKKDFGTEAVALLQSLNKVLAVAVIADRDFPPYHRIAMDGIAISSAAFTAGRKEFFIENIQAAGGPVLTLSDVNNCMEVMTGAVLPQQTDAVIPYEDCEITNGIATIKAAAVWQQQNIHRQATDSKAGTTLIEPDTIITPAHIGMMAAVGLSQVNVRKQPRIAICSTGDELVDVDAMPLPHQVRKSNVYMLAAALQKENISASLFHLPDDKNRMQQQLTAIMASHDVILLSGAVSRGKFDHLPEALNNLGMQTIFHRVAQRPGKPFLFGKFTSGVTVFGFPGNPVSTFVCYHIYFKKWLRASLRYPSNPMSAKLSAPVSLQSKLTNHILIKLKNKEGVYYANPFSFSTSGDMNSLLETKGIITIPPEKNEWAGGEIVEVIPC